MQWRHLPKCWFWIVATLTPPPVTSIHDAPYTESQIPNVSHPIEPMLSAQSPHLALPYLNLIFPNLMMVTILRCGKPSVNIILKFSIPLVLWVKIASLHFVRSTTFWLQSMDNTIRYTLWSDFSVIVCTRFERDQHNHLICQFFHIKQWASWENLEGVKWWSYKPW